LVEPSTVIFEFLGGNIGGYLIGRGVKTLTRILLTLTSLVGAVFVALLAALASQGYITVDWVKIADDLQAWVTETVANIVTRMPQIPVFLEQTQSFLAPAVSLGGGVFVDFIYGGSKIHLGGEGKGVIDHPFPAVGPLWWF